MDESDEDSPEEPSQIREDAPVPDDVTSSNTGEPSSSTGTVVARDIRDIPTLSNDIWQLVREYKDLRAREAELRNNLSDESDIESSVYSEMSDRAIIQHQLVALGDLDSRADEIAENVAMPMLASSAGIGIMQDTISSSAAGSSTQIVPVQSRPSIFEALHSIQDPREMTKDDLTRTVRQVTGNLESTLNSETSRDLHVTTHEAMDTSAAS